MNSLAKCIKNYLIVVNSDEYQQQLYKLCLEKVKEGSLVVLITCEYYDFSEILEKLIINKDELKNFVLMYYKTVDEVSRKLFSLHSWSLLPSIVAVDLTQLLRLELVTCPSSPLLLQKVVVCTVSLLAYLQSIANKLCSLAKTGNSSNVHGLLILKSEGKNFGDSQIQTLNDLGIFLSNGHASKF